MGIVDTGDMGAESIGRAFPVREGDRGPPPGVPERRQLADRRCRPTPLFSRYTLSGGRRAAARREGERALYVDRYRRRLLVALVAMLLLSCADAFCTLWIVNRLGGSEANPLMDWMLGRSSFAFVASKTLLTASGIVVLCLHKNFPGVKTAITALLLTYISVGCYHLYLLLAP
ncbi:MAG: DUF5658 family protein [Planctomycetota bacterium]